MQPAGCPAGPPAVGPPQPHMRQPAAGTPFPRRTSIIGERATAARTPPAPLARPGSARSYDPARPLARTWHLRGERRSHEARLLCPAKAAPHTKLQAETPLDTGPLLQG